MGQPFAPHSGYRQRQAKLFSYVKTQGKIVIGMNKNEVIASWGEPKDINRTVGAWGVHEQWIYGKTYLYFEDGILTSWQD